MLTRDEIEKLGFLTLFIACGVPNHDIPEQMFFYYGYLREITDSYIKIETKKGFRIVPINKIIDIHLTNRRGYFDY